VKELALERVADAAQRDERQPTRVTRRYGPALRRAGAPEPERRSTRPARRRPSEPATDIALEILVRENAEVAEQVKLGFEQALRALVQQWDERLRTVERERDQLLNLVDNMLVYGFAPETVQRADELASVIHAHVEEQHGGPAAAPVEAPRPPHLARLRALLDEEPEAARGA
jgi:hypothetical protein